MSKRSFLLSALYLFVSLETLLRKSARLPEIGEGRKTFDFYYLIYNGINPKLITIILEGYVQGYQAACSKPTGDTLTKVAF